MTTTTKQSTPSGSEADEPTENEQISFSDAVGSLTGYEEDLVIAKFGKPIGELWLHVSITKAYRALLFVLARRGGLNDGRAYKQAMEMTARDVGERFLDEDDDADDVDPDNPETDRGKGDSSSD